MKQKQLSFALITYFFAAVCVSKPAAAAELSIVATGLDHPRGLSFGPDGSLYVADAGSGGSKTCVSTSNLEFNKLCYGTSGAVIKIQNGQEQPVLTGLPSLLALPNAAENAGPDSIEFSSTGEPYVLIGYTGDPGLRDSALHASDLGTLVAANFATNSWKVIADVSNYELTNNPDHGDVVSDPYAFQIKNNTAYIVDSGGNDLLRVGLDGSNLQTVSVFPRQTITNPIFPSPKQAPKTAQIQSVPTGLGIGPDGAAYVGEFTGFPYPEGKARIFRVGPDGKQTAYDDGLTQLSDLTFDPQGNLYALQYANQSAWKGNLDSSVIKIAPDGTRTTVWSGNGLESATALTIGPDHDVYVINQGDTSMGEIVRIDNTTSVPEPPSTLAILGFAVLGIRWRQKRISTSARRT